MVEKNKVDRLLDKIISSENSESRLVAWDLSCALSWLSSEKLSDVNSEVLKKIKKWLFKNEGNKRNIKIILRLRMNDHKILKKAKVEHLKKAEEEKDKEENKKIEAQKHKDENKKDMLAGFEDITKEVEITEEKLKPTEEGIEVEEPKIEETEKKMAEESKEEAKATKEIVVEEIKEEEMSKAEKPKEIEVSKPEIKSESAKVEEVKTEDKVEEIKEIVEKKEETKKLDTVYHVLSEEQILDLRKSLNKLKIKNEDASLCDHWGNWKWWETDYKKLKKSQFDAAYSDLVKWYTYNDKSKEAKNLGLEIIDELDKLKKYRYRKNKRQKEKNKK